MSPPINLFNLIGFRFGHRTVEGIVKDGCNALQRYYLNNFCDGTKQVLSLHLCNIFMGSNCDVEFPGCLVMGHDSLLSSSCLFFIPFLSDTLYFS